MENLSLILAFFLPCGEQTRESTISQNRNCNARTKTSFGKAKARWRAQRAERECAVLGKQINLKKKTREIENDELPIAI